VRIVRLSQAQGRLVLDRGTGKVEATMPNMPIVERSRLATGDGFAEVEFEDGSTLRLPPQSQVDFPRLILRSTGAKATTIRLVKGTVYVNLAGTKGNEFVVETGNSAMTVEPSTHMRLDTAGGKANLTVFGGDVEMWTGTATTPVGKKHSITFNPVIPPESVEVAKKIEEIPYDQWDKRSGDFHDHYMNFKALGSSGYSYGVSDLNYYGAFSNAGGCGTMWRPYFTGAGWDPYANGVWAWYKGAGYSWVSPYPWGWLPYHSGAWNFCPGIGWGWRPGGSWFGLANANPTIISRPIPSKPGQPVQGEVRGGIPLRPPGPIHATGVPHNTLVISNRTALVFSHMDRPDNFVIRQNSAGLGVPRGEMGNLHRLSGHVEHNGFVNRQAYAQPMGGLRDNGSSSHNGVPLTIRSGHSGWARENSEAWRGQSASITGEHSGDRPAGSWNGSGQHHGDGFRGGGAAGGSPGSQAGGSHGGSMGGGGGGGFHGGGGGGGGGFHGGGGGGGNSAGSGGGGGGHSGSSGGGGHR
jgi:hypothetical protein